MKKFLMLLVRGYRYWLSPWLGSRCRFHPSCSCYAFESIEQYGPVRGLALALRRLARCHPWHNGGYDPVPPTENTRHG